MSNSVWLHRWQPTRLPRPWDSPGKNTGVGCHFLLQCMKVKSESEVTQSCPTLHDPMDCSPPGSSVHGIFQARVLEWGAIAFSAQYTLVSNNSLRWLIYHLRTSGKREGNRKRNYWISFFFHFSQLSVIRRHVQHTNNNNQPLLVRQRKSLGREREENMKKEREEGSKDCPQETWQLRKCSYYGARTEKSFL